MTNQSREDDNQVTGLPDLPKLIFLDTNIVQNLHSFGEFIFDRVSTPDLEKKLSTLGPRVTADIYALADFMALGVRAGWPLVLQRRFKEGCPRRHEARLGAWHESGWPVRYCPAYPPATAATLQVRTVPGAASHALPGTLGAGLSGASFPPQACCRLRRKAPPSRHRATW